MRYRALSADLDYTFGRGSANFLVNSSACVAQSVTTRLLLWAGEWFLDVDEGTPWMEGVLGTGKQGLYDQTIQQRVLETEGVVSLDAYSSQYVASNRSLAVSMTITTLYGTTPVEVVL